MVAAVYGFITLAITPVRIIGLCNGVRLSVCLARLFLTLIESAAHTQRDAPLTRGSTRRGQREFLPPDYYEEKLVEYVVLFVLSKCCKSQHVHHACIVLLLLQYR